MRKNSLVVVGQELFLNTLFFDYIQREAVKMLYQIDFIFKFQDVEEFNLKTILNDSEHLIIVSNSKFFQEISKELAKVTNDKLIDKYGSLRPLKSKVNTDDSFVLELEDDKKVNLTKVSTIEKIADISFNNKKVDTTLNIFGIDEQSSRVLLESLAYEFEAQIFSYRFIEGWSKVLVKARNFGRVSQFVDRAKEILPNKVIATDNIIEHIIERFSENGRTITFAESCTGGGLSKFFTSESGSSEIFEGSIVSYSNRIKNSWLGVRNENLESFGAVSEAVIKDMLAGVSSATDSDYAIAISGVAGPNGGSKEKPIGTVFIGVRDNIQNVEYIDRLKFEGDRNYIQAQSENYAVMMLVDLAKDILF